MMKRTRQMNLMMTMMMTTTVWMKATTYPKTKMKELQWKNLQTQNFPLDAFAMSDYASVDSPGLVDFVSDFAASADVAVAVVDLT